MGTKRPHSDNDVHPSRRPQVPAPSKKRKVNPHPHRKLEQSNHAINPLKSRIRSLERLLKHKENLPADVRLNHERELNSCRYELEEAEREKKKSELIGKYHMVRFFDRQKATRKLKQTKRKAKETAGDKEKAAWEQKVHECEVDVNYAQYYPLDQPYSALYPTKGKKKRKGADESEEGSGADGDADKQEEERQGDPDMWKVVEICMQQGKLDKLRNGILMKSASRPKTDDDIAARERKADKKKDKKATKGEKSIKEKQPAAQEDDEDSDGGFFE